MLGFGFGYNKILPKLGNCLDPDALEFISAHEAATGLPMGDTQKTAICGFVSRLKGNGTTNGSDIWTTAVNSNALIYPLTPIDNSTANADAYSVELISGSTVGIYFNFLPADITPSGVKGGTGKWFNTTTPPNTYPQDDASIGAYITVGTNASSIIGGSDTPPFLLQNSASSIIYRLNTSSGGSYIDPNRIGFYMAQRENATKTTLYKDGVNVQSILLTSGVPSSKNTFFHQRNSLSGNYYDGTLAMYVLGLPSLTDNEQADFYEAVQWYQTNVITGGRNV